MKKTLLASYILLSLLGASSLSYAKEKATVPLQEATKEKVSSVVEGTHNVWEDVKDGVSEGAAKVKRSKVVKGTTETSKKVAKATKSTASNVVEGTKDIYQGTKEGLSEGLEKVKEADAIKSKSKVVAEPEEKKAKRWFNKNK